MSCNTFNGIDDCLMSTGGISKVYLFPYNSLYDYEYTADNLNFISDYKINTLGVELLVKPTSLLSEELQKGNTDIYNYSLNLTIQKMEWEKRAELFKMIRGKMTLIIKDKNGKCWLFGKDSPARVTTYNATTAGSLEDNIYELTFATFSKEPLKQIKCYDPVCAISVAGSEVRTSFFTINNASTYNFTGLYELLGDTITRSVTPITPLDPTNWSNPAILAADTATIQSIVNPNGNSVVQLAYDGINDDALIIIYSSDTSYPFMTIGGQPLTGTVEILVNLQTTLSTSLTGVVITVEDSLSNIIYTEPLGDAVTGTGLSGIAENSYINVSQLYPLGEEFTVSVTFNETQCSFAGYTYEYEPSSECQMINTYSLHNGRHYSCRVEEMGTGFLYRDITIVIGEYQFPLYNSYLDYSSNFPSLQNAVTTALSFYPDLNISNVTVTADVKSWILEFDSVDDDLDFYVITRGDDTVTLTSSEPNVRKFLSERSIVLALQTAAPSDSSFIIQNPNQSFDLLGDYGVYPSAVFNGRLEEVAPFTNAVTNSIGIDISDWDETDNIVVANTTVSCPDVTNTFTIDTCFDTTDISQNRTYWRYVITSNDLGTVIEFDTTIGIFTINLPSNLVAGNYPDFGDMLNSIPEIQNANIQYNAALNIFILEFFTDASVTVNTVESSNAGFFTLDAQYDEYRYTVTPKQHPDIQFNWGITSANLTVSLAGSCKDYINTDFRNVVKYLDFEYNTGANRFDINFVSNSSDLGDWYIDFFYTHPDLSASQYQEVITAGSPNWNIGLFSTLLTPASITHIRFRNDAGYEQYFRWNGTTVNTIIDVETVNLFKEIYGRFDDCRILSSGVHTTPTLVRSSLNCPNIDPDVINFMTAASLVDPAIETALSVFVTTLKVNGLWTKFDAIYPFVGGTATTHKFNLINPLDTNAAFRITFNGGWVHNSNGVTGNAINTFGNTWYDDNLYAIDNDHHISIYSRSNTNIQQCDMGNFNAVNRSTNIFARFLDRVYFRNQSAGASFTANTDSRGWFCSNRVGNTEVRSARNSTLIVQPEAFTGKTSGRPYYIGTLNQGSIAFTSARNYSFASIGKGFTDAELVILYNAVQTLQTALSRQV